MFYPITPCPMPRMTRSDVWKKRPAVLRYRTFCDEVRARRVKLPVPGKVVFHIGMPKSWSEKKKAANDGQPHMQKPDADNCFKALGDALHDDDSGVWSVWIEKRWSRIPGITITEI